MSSFIGLDVQWLSWFFKVIPAGHINAISDTRLSSCYQISQESVSISIFDTKMTAGGPSETLVATLKVL
jgi:hypothetical protein